MKYVLTAALALVTLFGCIKEGANYQTFISDLPIVSTNTPTTSNIGDSVVSHVRCELPSRTGSVVFKGLQVAKQGDTLYNIRAIAEFTQKSDDVTVPGVWAVDTILTVKTPVAGNYVLRFFNGNTVFKSDTVVVD